MPISIQNGGSCSLSPILPWPLTPFLLLFSLFPTVTKTLRNSKALCLLVPRANPFVRPSCCRTFQSCACCVLKQECHCCSFLNHCFHYYERLKACGKNNINIIAIYAEVGNFPPSIVNCNLGVHLCNRTQRSNQLSFEVFTCFMSVYRKIVIRLMNSVTAPLCRETEALWWQKQFACDCSGMQRQGWE